MLYGTTGTLNFKEMAPLLGTGKLQILAFIFAFSGFAFKLSAVPFHLWTADVYEGAPVPVTAYLSVISKGSIVFIFITSLFQLFHNYNAMWYNMLYLTILLTISVGNLFAIRQDNIKRFLAFSSIAQVGYILLGISSGTSLGASSAIFFLIVYTFSNLGAFGVVSLVASKAGKENISDYKGFYKNNKFASWVMAICLFSLAGIPPTAGFFGKMFLVTAGAAKGNYVLVTVAAMNMVISLFYYLRVIKAIFIDDNDQPIEKLAGSISLRIALAICITGAITMGFASGMFDYINAITGK
jgi:NADH-quinone oxidoreductase subunit N